MRFPELGAGAFSGIAYSNALVKGRCGMKFGPNSPICACKSVSLNICGVFVMYHTVALCQNNTEFC